MNIDNIPLGCNAFWFVMELPEAPNYWDAPPREKQMRGHVIAKTKGSVTVTYPLNGAMVREDLEPSKIVRIES